ncbi:MAG: glycosyltransferase family 2 protein [Armatimonadetes bacterium]|nr:glycosyltransferase family 2 protein [Armatimonadota bacterium]
MSILESVFWVSWGLIFYTYGLYPVLLAALSRWKGREPEGTGQALPEGELPRVAMVVAAYNEIAVIEKKLANTWKIDYPEEKFQLWVGSDGSADGTAEILKAEDHPQLRAFPFEERRGKMAVLNDLMSRVDADIVVMSDANTIYAPDAVRKLVRHFQDPELGCVSGVLSLEQDGGVSGEGLYWKYEVWIKRNESRLGFLIGCNGGIYSIRRELYEPLPPSTIVDDFVLTMRILEKGYRIVLDPEARATEPPCPSARDEMVRKIRIGAGDFQALSLTRGLLHPRHGLRSLGFWSHKVMRWLVPFFLLAALLSNVGLIGSPLYLSLLGLQLAGAGLSFWAYNARPGVTVPRWTRPISYFYLMNYALFCGFLRFLFRTQRVTWERTAR